MSVEQSITVGHISLELWISSGQGAYLRWVELPFEALRPTLEKIVGFPISEDSYLTQQPDGTYQLFLRSTPALSDGATQLS